MYANLKKKYGQNFLIDKNILKKISNLIPSKKLNILEIGPGDGRLTNELLFKNPLKLTLVEIDEDLVSTLQHKYSNDKFINIINSNILELEISEKYELVISNLPYNISSQILVKLSLLKNSPNLLILMFQKEFAQRLLDKKINSINSLIKCFYDVNYNFNVSKNCFRPIPKVDSTVLTFKKKEVALISDSEIQAFVEFKRELFSHKRKSLKNLLRKYHFKEKFNLDLRVENLELTTLVKIFREINL